MNKQQGEKDIILIGAGIMSATLGALLKELSPEWNIKVFEKLEKPGEESSNEWNNAGTGHAALCELNYTNEQPDGSVDISKAISINEKFQVSKQFWSYLVKSDLLHDPRGFIMPLPHISYVRGDHNVSFLRTRYEKMSAHPLFSGMEFSEDPEVLEKWMPLMMKDRQIEEPIAASKIADGTDVNFGSLTSQLFGHLEKNNVEMKYNHDVDDITRNEDGTWEVKVRNHQKETLELHEADFVFIGGGGGSLHLLQKSGIPEGKGIGGFPVSGQFMVCQNPDIVNGHFGKVYGKAPVGAPPMSVPHLDTRYINNQETLLFGPFAGFSPKFLKTGSLMDLLKSVKPDNLITMMAAGAKNIPLTKYLISQVIQSKEQRMEELREFVPSAKTEDWEPLVAGQRVQVIKDTEEGKGILQFGTEVISAEDGSIAALLGASPGASTAVSVMLEIIEKCFPQHLEDWEPKLKEMIPSYGINLSENPEMIEEIHKATEQVLGLKNQKQPQMT